MIIDLNRARGVLWGQAVGDALGTTVEFRDEPGIATRAETRWPRDLVGGGPFDVLPGQVTDDTELALSLARTLARVGRYDDDAIAEAYLAWFASEPFDFGRATSRAFRAPAKSAEEVRKRADPKTEANGSLMRSSPLGVFGASMPREALATLAMRDSALSHPSPVCRAACAVFVTTIADALTSGSNGAELYERALTFARTHAPLVADTLEDAAEGIPVSDDEHNQGWVRIALQHAFFQLKHASDFEQALVQTVVKGGDTDTNGCITGALLGAVLGVDSIPARWRSTVAECRPARPERYWCNDLDALVNSLARGEKVSHRER